MIVHLTSPSTETGRFPATELPVSIQRELLADTVIPRIMSDSMTPTLLKGDRLRLIPADSIQVGDLLVYRRNGLLICHRVQHAEGACLYLKGDASAGPPERIDRTDVVGLVTSMVRGGRPAPLSRGVQAQTVSAACESLRDRCAALLRERGRSSVRLMIQRLARLPLGGLLIRHLVYLATTVDIRESAALQTVNGQVTHRRVPLRRTLALIEYLRNHATDRNRMTLVFRLGPVFLGRCRLSPWSCELRQAAKALGFHEFVDRLRRESIQPE